MADDRAVLKARFATLGQRAAGPPPLPVAATSEAVPICDTLANPVGAAPVYPDKIQLKLRRSQSQSFGTVAFSVHVIAELAPAARRAVEHYKLGTTILYQKDLELKFTLNFVLALLRYVILLLTRKRWQITINDLVKGRTVSAKNVVELLRIEADIRQAAETFAKVLRLAATFGGEELVEL